MSGYASRIPLYFTGCDEHNGTKTWYVDGKIHRTDGPAYIDEAGCVKYYLNDLRYWSKEAWFDALTLEQQEALLWNDEFYTWPEWYRNQAPVYGTLMRSPPTYQMGKKQ